MCLGIPGQIVAVPDPAVPMAIVEVGGIRRPINIAFIVDESRSPAQCVGEWVLVHVGFAMSRLDAEEAEATLALLAELGDAEEELELLRSSASSSPIPDDAAQESSS